MQNSGMWSSCLNRGFRLSATVNVSDENSNWLESTISGQVYPFVDTDIQTVVSSMNEDESIYIYTHTCPQNCIFIEGKKESYICIKQCV